MNQSTVLNELKKILNQSKHFKNLSFVGNNYALLKLDNKIFNISFNETTSKDYYTKISVKIINLNYSIIDTIEFYLSNYSENKTGISFSSNYGWDKSLSNKELKVLNDEIDSIINLYK